LKSNALEIVMVANYGYLPGKVNFSCRIAKCARQKDPPVNIIECLKEVAGSAEGNLVERLGSNFARGHKEASGGIVATAEFEELCKLIRLGEKPNKAAGTKAAKELGNQSPQKNTIVNYFRKA
jgi:hypothetical protein